MTVRAVDVHALPAMLTALRLPSFHRHWTTLAQCADTEGWPAARFLAALAEVELAERETRRIQRHLADSRLPGGKTLATFDFKALPAVPRARSVEGHEDRVVLIHFERPDLVGHLLPQRIWRIVTHTAVGNRLRIERQEPREEAVIVALTEHGRSQHVRLYASEKPDGEPLDAVGSPAHPVRDMLSAAIAFEPVLTIRTS